MLQLQLQLQPYVDSIYYAFLIFPFLAAIITIPFLILQYHRYGSVLIFRSVIVYSLILYLVCMYFLVILPLPSFADAAANTAPYLQLHPLHFLSDLRGIDGFAPRILSTYRILLHNSYFWQAFLNVLLFVPLGVYLKYYFRRNWIETILIAFGVSLFFEVTQLTAIYGIYPRPYRMFDVDDLLLNTSGAFFGHIFAPLLTIFLPKRESMDRKSIRKSQEVSLLRRFTANLVDCGIIALIFFLLQKPLGLESLSEPGLLPVIFYFFLVFLYFILLPYITKGRTVGKALVKLIIVTEKNTTPRFSQYAIRNGLLYGVMIPSLLFAFQLNQYSHTAQISPIVTFFVGVFALIFIGSFGYYFLSRTKGKGQFLHEKWSHTKLESTF